MLTQQIPRPLHVRASTRRVSVLGVGLLAVVLGSVALQTPMLAVGAAIWLAGLAIMVGACAYADSLTRLRTTRMSRLEVGAVLGVLTGAVALRVWALDSYPNGIHIDEAVMGLISRDILDGNGPHPFGFAFISDPAPLMYVKAAFMALFGDGMMPQRLMTAVGGILGIVALWLLARPLFGPGVALLGAALLAASASHIHFSRLALSIIEIPLFGVLALALVWRGLVTGQVVWHLLGGMALGFAQYANFGARAYVLAVAALYLICMASAWRGWFAPFRGGVVAGVAMVAVLLPQLLYVRDDPAQLVDRLRFRSVFRRWDQATDIHQTTDPVMVMVGQAVINVRAFIDEPDRGPFYEFTREPLLYWPVAVAFVVGALIAIWRIRNPRYASLLLVCASVVLAGMLSAGAPQFHRLVPMQPIVCLLAAIGLLSITGRVGRLIARARPAVATGISVLAALALVGITAYDGLDGMLVRHPARFPWQPHSAWARWVGEQQADRPVYVAAAPDVRVWDERLRFLGGHRALLDVTNPTDVLPRIIEDNGPATIGLSPRLDDWRPLIQQQFPDAVVTRRDGPDGKPLLLSVAIPAAPRTPPQGGGLRGSLLIDGRPPEEAQPRLDAAIVFREAGLLTDGESYEVRWTGTLLVPTSGRYRLEMFTDGWAELIVDGETVASSRTATAPRSVRGDVTLTAGAHPIELGYRYLRGPGVMELRWQPPGADRSLIPPSALRPD